MKNLVLIASVLLASCGGGSGGDEQIEPQPTTPPPTPVTKIMEYRLTQNGSTQSYTGHCIESKEIFYCYPTVIANSPYVVSATIEGDKVKLFSYATRGLIGEFSGTSGHTLTMLEVGAVAAGNLNGEWFNKSSAGSAGDAIISATYSDGTLTATDTNGCYMSGTIVPDGQLYSAHLTIVDCAEAGEYVGAIHVTNEQVRGAVSSGEHSLVLDFNIN